MRSSLLHPAERLLIIVVLCLTGCSGPQKDPLVYHRVPTAEGRLELPTIGAAVDLAEPTWQRVTYSSECTKSVLGARPMALVEYNEGSLVEIFPRAAWWGTGDPKVMDTRQYKVGPKCGAQRATSTVRFRIGHPGESELYLHAEGVWEFDVDVFDDDTRSTPVQITISQLRLLDFEQDTAPSWFDIRDFDPIVITGDFLLFEGRGAAR